MAKKIIATLKAPLQQKYGTDFVILERLFRRLVKADIKRGLATHVIYIDELQAAERFSYSMPHEFGEKTCKDILDQIYSIEQPEYLVVFGAHDVFPFQSLKNELYKPGGDRDEFILSDLPYACEAPYSVSAQDFINPTRVMGRIPDQPAEASGRGDIGFVKAVIEHCITARPAKKEVCNDYFASSAQVWTGSTRISLVKMFANAFDLKISPATDTGMYTAQDISKLPHFLNLHGALDNPQLYGQRGASYPIAIQASDIGGMLTPGCFAVAESCYGAQLISPKFGKGIATTYLENKASVFMGSSTLSYGSANTQMLADLITQYFMLNLLNGASSGRAFLDARQKFVSVNGPTLDFHELKTLAQFVILGDPSLVPVASTENPEIIDTIEGRRNNLVAKGMQLGLTTTGAHKFDEVATNGPRHDFSQLFGKISPDFSFAGYKEIFEAQELIGSLLPAFSKSLHLREYTPSKVRYHVYQKGSIVKDNICNFKVLVIKEQNDNVVGWRQYVSR